MGWQDDHRKLKDDGWRQGRDKLWRNDRFGGSYKTVNALRRIGSLHGEITQELSEDRQRRIRTDTISERNPAHAGAYALMIYTELRLKIEFPEEYERAVSQTTEAPPKRSPIVNWFGGLFKRGR